MAQVLCQLPPVESDKLLVGLDKSDDAAVYKLNEDTALIQTLDFFTPVVDDPYVFGQIAASNSLSDIYAMGGKPILALNIVCFPTCLSMDILAEILKGGSDKVREAGALLVGGHTVDDNEPKYGLSVSGIVHPHKVLSNSNAKPGDVLVLTKPIGLGILNTAIKADMLDEKIQKKAIETMISLNDIAAEGMEITKVNSCTDITGFGFLGHAFEMAKGSEVSIVIDSKAVPIIEGAIENAQMGLVPAGAYRNEGFLGDNVEFEKDMPVYMKDILFDPQTSGGLLISIEKENVNKLLEFYDRNLKTQFSIVGEVVEKQEKYLIVK
ncbi:selenophosphate synthase [Paramaledivibacter caminithermalis DSM 15212]|uniref:Selenide, water dikinase n=1 Tax=Paramaledivibacter caminithermalis (strain DSM 15212 / CIP 107654 / DViRD3) TaxID=1121301 RepID=A0A1M6MGJ5_PARC5|nr:selenophosphate synthase [Paramaledivibacter caminithermalis DSM 15212]